MERVEAVDTRRCLMVFSSCITLASRGIFHPKLRHLAVALVPTAFKRAPGSVLTDLQNICRYSDCILRFYGFNINALKKNARQALVSQEQGMLQLSSRAPRAGSPQGSEV